jgi:hypothetical protein
MKIHEAVLLSAAMSFSIVQPGTTVLEAQGGDVTVRGCVEQDAASRAPVYKLIAGDQIYRLEAPSTINVSAELGHTVEATGAVTKKDSGRPGHQELVMSVRQLRTVADRCS